MPAQLERLIEQGLPDGAPGYDAAVALSSHVFQHALDPAQVGDLPLDSAPMLSRADRVVIPMEPSSQKK